VLIGGIVLAGVVVNNAIVLVDYANQLQSRGLALNEALLQAGSVRLRPILISTLTTVLGLLPMALSGGEGSEIRQPLAVTIIAGLLSATVLTLVVVPALYRALAGSWRRR
jgi:HAE1 family hydrophobic/amphiphilic exporter-1